MNIGNKGIPDLAQLLVNNHLWASFTDASGKEMPDIANSLAERMKSRSGKVRTIAVIGAGASLSAGLRDAKNAADALCVDVGAPGAEFQDELNRLKRVSRLNVNEFETRLLAIGSTEYRSKALRKAVQAGFQHRHSPLRTYEILAHMFKHRFVDAIINFNFDELLDQSIADELNSDEYHCVVSDGDCPTYEELSAVPLRYPVYIKPHGTASHPSTLRFTRDAYHNVPSDIERVVSQLLRPGSTESLQAARHPVVIIAIGFGMQSFEFNEEVNQAAQGSQIFFLNAAMPNPLDALEGHLEGHLIKVDKEPASPSNLHGQMAELWTEVSKSLVPFKTRDIKRHELVCTLLDRDVMKDNVPSDPRCYTVANYLQDRFALELCLSIAKGKGLVSIDDLAIGRCGRYYDMWREKAKDNRKTLYDYCIIMGLANTGYSRDALRMQIKGLGSASPPSVISSSEFNNLVIPHLKKTLLETNTFLSPSGRARIELEKSSQMFEDTLKSMYASMEVEIRTRIDPVSKSIFDHPQDIRTETALVDRTMQLLKRRWRWLLCVAETGEWMLPVKVSTRSYNAGSIIKARVKELKRKNQEGGVVVLYADSSYLDKLTKEFFDRVEGEPIDWWKHNRHMTLALNSDCDPMGSIYFHRPLRAQSVCPISLDRKDSNTLFDCFIAYWCKAKGRKWSLSSAKDEKTNFIKMLKSMTK